MLQIQGLRVAYPDAPALVSGWSAQIGPGVTELHGDTGSGKTTLLRVLAGEQPASAGQLVLAGTALQADAQRYRAQVFHVDPATRQHDQRTGRACLAALGEGGTGPDLARLDALVEGFGLGPHIDKPLYMLSTGSKRKVWLAAALVSQRALILLDEPTAALDGGSIQCLWQALDDMAKLRERVVVVASSERIGGLPLAASFVLPL